MANRVGEVTPREDDLCHIITAAVRGFAGRAAEHQSADRLREYLARCGLTREEIRPA